MEYTKEQLDILMSVDWSKGYDSEHYHTRGIKKCKYCTADVKRAITPNGRNKGYYKTCGSLECTTAMYRDKEVCMKKSHPGRSNPNWIENKTKIKRPLSSYEGARWRRQVFERDNYTCQKCGQTGGKLNAHHIFSYAKFPELRLDLDNGQTLCIACHKKTDTYAVNKELQNGTIC